VDPHQPPDRRHRHRRRRRTWFQRHAYSMTVCLTGSALSPDAGSDLGRDSRSGCPCQVCPDQAAHNVHDREGSRSPPYAGSAAPSLRLRKCQSRRSRSPEEGNHDRAMAARSTVSSRTSGQFDMYRRWLDISCHSRRLPAQRGTALCGRRFTSVWTVRFRAVSPLPRSTSRYRAHPSIRDRRVR
jgi:hypothetical protein